MKDSDILKVRELLNEFSKDELVLIAESNLLAQYDNDMEKIELLLGILKSVNQKNNR